MSNGCVHDQFSCALNLARKYEIDCLIDCELVKQLVSWQLPNKSRHLDELTHEPPMAMWYWSVAILFWQLSIDHIVNGQYNRYGFAKTHLKHPSLPFDSLPYPNRTICRRVRTYVRSVSHVTTKRKEVDHIPWVWGSVPRALRTRGSPAIILQFFTILQENLHSFNIHDDQSTRFLCTTNYSIDL